MSDTTLTHKQKKDDIGRQLGLVRTLIGEAIFTLKKSDVGETIYLAERSIKELQDIVIGLKGLGLV